MDEAQEYDAYADHLRAEHRRLEESILRVKRDWPALGADTPSPASVEHSVGALTQLRAELANHFREEKEGGCLEEAVCRCPSLGHEADRIEDEHVALLDGLDEIILRLKAAREALKTVNDLRDNFDTFTQKLRAHEKAEDVLLETAFGIPVE